MADAETVTDSADADGIEGDKPVLPMSARLARLGIVLAIGTLVYTQIGDPPTVTIDVRPDGTFYTTDEAVPVMAIVLVVLMGLVSCVLLLRRGVLRLVGVGLLVLTSWMIYTVVTIYVSPHYVQVTDDRVVRLVGTTADPIRSEIHFPTTRRIRIKQEPVPYGTRFELVAEAIADGAESVIPISTMMQAAMPQILESAASHNVFIDEASVAAWKQSLEDE